MEDKIKNLLDAFTNYSKINEQWAQFLNNSDEENKELVSSGIGSCWYYYEKYALCKFFIDNNLVAAKQHFYTCGMLDAVAIGRYNSNILEYGLNHLSYALLSDSMPLIQRYALLAHSNFEKAVQSGIATASFVMQCLMRNDWEGYERGIQLMRTKALKKYPGMHLDISFYESIAEKNKAKAEQVLAEFVSPKVHKQRNKHNILLGEFISHPALGYAKLAWLKGLPVEVHSPLVPQCLLPVQPLATYKNEYAFLEGVL